jgi:hypothetical protein
MNAVAGGGPYAQGDLICFHARREQHFRHMEEMVRINSDREIADRKYEAEMADRREDRAAKAVDTTKPCRCK